MDELLALLGGGWQSLLLYPGVLAGILATLVMRAIWPARGMPWLRRVGRVWWEPGATLYAACALLLLALLPFPRSYWAYPIDLVGALALIEVPHWLRLARLPRADDAAVRSGAAAETGALLNVYPLLALAVMALGQASGSLLLTEVKGGQQTLRWAGLATWAIAMPPLIGLGPWHVERTAAWPQDLRRVAHIALLLALALPAGDQWGHGATAIGAALAFGSLTALHHLWRGEPERWERLQPLVALALLAFLLYTSATAWMARLR